VQNNAGQPIELFWIDTINSPKDSKSGPDLVLQTSKPIRNSTSTQINSYNTHKFRIKFRDQSYSSSSVDFAKVDTDETVTVSYNRDTDEMTAVSRTDFHDFLDTTASATKNCKEFLLGGLDEEAFSSCIAQELKGEFDRITAEASQLTSYRGRMAEKLRNYTCADHDTPSSVPIDSYAFETNDATYTLNILLDTDSAKIWTVDDIITDEECAVLKEYGLTRLTRATVAAEDGSSILSESRKANQ
jgi:hypothetical protein